MTVLTADAWTKWWAQVHLASPAHPMSVVGVDGQPLTALFQARGVSSQALQDAAKRRNLWRYQRLEPESLDRPVQHPDTPRQLLFEGDAAGPGPRGLYITLAAGDQPLRAWLERQLGASWGTSEQMAPALPLWGMSEALSQTDLVTSTGQRFALVQRDVDVVDPWFRLVYAENPGAAWGVLRSASPALRTGLFTIFALGAVLLLTLYALRAHTRWASLGCALVIGGALGNLLDRLRFSVVIDFVLHAVGQWAWPVYNVADVAISVGAMTLVLCHLRGPSAPRAGEARQ